MMQARTVRCCTLSGSRNGRELVQDHARDRMAPYSCFYVPYQIRWRSRELAHLQTRSVGPSLGFAVAGQE